MPSLEIFAKKKLQEKSQKRQLRLPQTIERLGNGYILHEAQRYLSFSCNDYLGFSHHPKIIGAANAGLERYGAGAGASRLVTGNHPLYEILEAKIAAWHEEEAACLFGSGYLANIGVIPALAGRDTTIFADKLVHSSILAGIRLSQAKLKRYSHNNLNSFSKILNNRDIIATESVFSMDGDRTPIVEIHSLAKTQDAWIIIDTAHDLKPLKIKENTIKIGTLSKAIGAYGGYAACSQTVIDMIKTYAQSLIYSTALPASILAGAIAAFELLEADPVILDRPLEKADYFCSLLNLPKPQSQIVPIILKSNEKALEASRALRSQGFWVSAIRPPTVPVNTARLRLVFCAYHQKNDIELLAEHIKPWIS